VDPIVTVSSGNLAMIYLAEQADRVDEETIDEMYPELILGLAGHPGIGFVVVHSRVDGPVAIGAAGRHRLRDGHVEGADPLFGFGHRAAPDLLAHQGVAHVGDLVLVSSIDQGTDEVAAFEELVGSHGGIGGWQTEALLLHPAGWPLRERTMVGPAAVHRQLVAWLADLGLRSAPENAQVPASTST
jgi:hypothetical protein